MPESCEGEQLKRYRKGTERICTPADTYEKIRPHLTSIGITRVANVTGLDRIGLPVVMVTRPNSRSLSVSQGKGLDLIEARVSGIMEAIELHHAEFPRVPVRIDTFDNLSRNHQVASPSTLPLSQYTIFEDSLS